MTSRPLKEQLITLIDDYRDLNPDFIAAYSVPTAVHFAKQVSKGYPCTIHAYMKTKNRAGFYPPTTHASLRPFSAFEWSKQDLVNLIDDKVEVAVTPNGRADDLHHVHGQEEPVFLTPATVEMTMQELLARVSPGSTKPHSSQTEEADGSAEPVYYLQSQNSNLTTPPLSKILECIPQNFPFAEPVLGDPEAINIWIGDHRSVTSTHRDPYENLYLVLKGAKTFTLYPPVDEITLPTRLVRTGKYVYDATSNKFSTQLDISEDSSQPPPRIPWVTIDPLRPRDELVNQHEMYAYATPRTVTVLEGCMLYLPAGWYHHVQQECGIWDEDGSPSPCIALNYWYDTEYEGEKYAMRQLIGRLKTQVLEEEELNRQEKEALNGSKSIDDGDRATDS